MLKPFNLCVGLLVAIVLSRWLPMTMMPLMDTTEARYAEIARIMAESGDWITPWFNDNVPFWGKPPLSFWTQALSFRILGVTEFAARLPSWLANLGVLTLVYHVTRTIAGRGPALIATLVFSTMALSFVLSGAVLTDPFLVLGTTLSLVSLILTIRAPGSGWRWWFFIGLSIGLLAKGPLALVLIGGPVVLWIAWRREWLDLRTIPWARGLLLTALLSLPWYIVAELTTPGFINYFIVGEHFLRFVDSGWSGDLYGSAHKQPYGTIWLHWLWATFPWGPFAIGMLIWRKLAKRKTPLFDRRLNDEQRLLLLATLFPSLFFTFSGNILWTYQLPALAPFAILFSMGATQLLHQPKVRNCGVAIVLAIVPISLVTAGIYTYINPHQLKTQKALVAHYDEYNGDETKPLIYVGKPPFSAQFYSNGHVTQMDLSEMESLLHLPSNGPQFLAVANGEVDQVIEWHPDRIKTVAKNRRFTLLRAEPQSASDTPRIEDLAISAAYQEH